LIKELFSNSGKGVKPGAAKADANAKQTTVVTAAAKPVTTAAAVVAAQPVAAPVPASTAVTATPAKSPEQPAAKAVEAPAKSTTVQSAAEVLKAVNGWAQAWSNNDVNGYLGYYAADFQTPRGEPRSDWEAARKARIAKPKKIDVKVEIPKVSFGEGGRVSVTFRQNYNSPNLKVTNMKTLVLVKNGERWLIQQELVGS